MILDLSHGVQIGNVQHPSVNEATNPDIAPHAAMAELGSVLPCLIYAVATAPDAQGPVLFSKLDIKDGYWRMVVPKDDDWHFAYVLPKAHPDEPTRLVIPSSLQMGWCDSPAYFCAASETARDVADKLADKPIGSLAAHPLEDMLLRPQDWPEDELEMHSQAFVRLMEVYVDDFIQLAQTTDPTKLLHLSRAILHAIHSVFPPPGITGHDGEDPVSLKKLKQGKGLWEARKEILGWVFDGARRCIELPEDKVNKITAKIKHITQSKSVSSKQLEKLQGKLRHACIGLPAGKGLMGPIDAALHDAPWYIKMKRHTSLANALQDFGTLICILGQCPTHCQELICDVLGYIGYCDASKLGAGGMWLSGNKHIPPTVW